MSLPKKLIWIAVTVLGVVALAILALSRGEPVSALWIIVAGLCALAISYRFYSKWLATKVLVLNDERATPAVVRNDGKDFVPTNRWMVFGHHFAAIAGPGPLVGPVLAAQFGFLPGTLWILIGATLGGGVHDMIILFASVRRNGKTLGQIVREEIGAGVGVVALISVLAIMIILLAVLALVVVQALAHSPWGVFTIAMTIPVAFLMGIGLRTGRLSVMAVTIFGVAGLFFSVWGGQFVNQHPALQAWFTYDQKWLAWAIMIYGLAASVLPVWMLLTPRDYLSTFLKLGTVAALGIAVILLRPVHADAGAVAVHRRHRARFCRTGLPVCLHHDRLRRGFRVSLADRFRHDAENACSANLRIRTIGYGAMVTGDDGGVDGDGGRVRHATGRILRDQLERRAGRR